MRADAVAKLAIAELRADIDSLEELKSLQQESLANTQAALDDAAADIVDLQDKLVAAVAARDRKLANAAERCQARAATAAAAQIASQRTTLADMLAEHEAQVAALRSEHDSEVLKLQAAAAATQSALANKRDALAKQSARQQEKLHAYGIAHQRGRPAQQQHGSSASDIKHMDVLQLRKYAAKLRTDLHGEDGAYASLKVRPHSDSACALCKTAQEVDALVLLHA